MSASHGERHRGGMTRGVALTAVVALVSGGIGFILGQMQATGRVTQLAIAPCGLGEAPTPVGLPLTDLLRKSDGHGVSLGPFRHDGLDRAVTVRFAPGDPGDPGGVAPYRYSDADGHDLLVLPLSVSGRSMPDEIRLECRYGTVARVQYRSGQTREAFDIGPAPTRADLVDG